MYTQAPLGFSFNPIKAVKKVGHGVATGAKATAHGVAKGAKFVAVTANPILVATMVASKAALKFALRPLRAIVGSVAGNRAKSVAAARGSNKPTPAEVAAAHVWAKNEFSKHGPQGKLIAKLAGANVAAVTLSGALGAEPVTDAAIIAAIGSLTAAASVIAKKIGKGQAVTSAAQTAAQAAASPDSLTTQAQKYAEKQLAPAPEPTTEPASMPAKTETPEDLTKQADAEVEKAATEDTGTMEGHSLGYSALDAYDDAALLGAVDPPSNRGIWVAIFLGAVAAGTGVAVAMKRR